MKNRGFTLIEILIAITILSIIAILMFRGLQIVLKTKERIESTGNDLTSLQIGMILLQQDLQQIVNRPVINNQGQLDSPLSFSTLPAVELAFTRSGSANPNSVELRSTLERVSYRFEKNQLIRITWPVLDRVQSTRFNKQVLLTEVQTVNWRFLSNDNQFYTYWPVEKKVLPKGIETEIIFKYLGEIKILTLLKAQDPFLAKNKT